MKRESFISKPGNDTQEGKLLKYREACRVYEEMQKNQEVLRYMMELFGEVETKINQALIGLPLYELVYDRVGDSAQAFDHNGVRMQVSFKVRDTNSTLVYNVRLDVKDIFELTYDELINRILRYAGNPQYTRNMM